MANRGGCIPWRGIFGFVAIIVVTLFKIDAIDIMDDKVTANIFLTPVAGALGAGGFALRLPRPL